MVEEINPAVIKYTQETLGKYVKKPSLTDKLLKKPPFRFLHDVFAVVVKETGCFEGLYTAEELNSENIKDRDDKMRFLKKMIDVVRICTNVPMTVKTSKIVAGHEPEKTNELLQLMAKIIENKLHWQPAVEQVLRGKEPKTVDKPTEETPKEKDTRKVKESSKTGKTGASKIVKQPSTNKEEDKIKRPKDKEKTTSTKERKSPPKAVRNEEKTTTRKSKESAKPKLAKADSQGSNKSISPDKDIKSNKKEAELLQCNHDDEQEKTSIKRRNSNVKNNNLDSLQPEILSNIEHFGISTLAKNEEISEKSNKTPSLNASKETLETPSKKQDINSSKSSAKSSKSIDLTAANEPLMPKSVEKELQQQSEIIKSRDSPEKIEKYDLPETLTKQEISQAEPIAASSAAQNKSNEVKRESTFTRENSQELANKTNRPRTSLRPPTARPASARPGAPRRRDRNVEIILQPNDQIKMSGIQVKLETFGDLDDDGENLVIIENSNAGNDGLSNDLIGGGTETQAGSEEPAIEQGHLVQQILETQKELTQQKDFNHQIKSDKDSVNGMVMKQTSMNNLRDVIQSLTKSVNPLGKLMDFIPEDIDAMQLEFTMWRDAYTQAANQLKREKSLTESATEPMKNQLVQIEANILEYMDMIDAGRVKILQNNDKILKMLTSS